jgi:dGTP triphosphohydrolase
MAEALERTDLAPGATLSTQSKGRALPEPPDPWRTCFERDRDRILHSKAFRRLKHKTQVFMNPEGDHYVTRLTHTLQVTQVGGAIARALSLNDALTEAICLGHDVGHSPFGHTGEDTLSEFVEGEWRHSEQSVRLFEVLEPLNLTETGPLTFEAPDMEKFPCLKLAYQAVEAGGTYPAVLNGANEVAVGLFLKGKIPFTGIHRIIAGTLEAHECPGSSGLDEVLEADARARERALALAGENYRVSF